MVSNIPEFLSAVRSYLLLVGVLTLGCWMPSAWCLSIGSLVTIEPVEDSLVWTSYDLNTGHAVVGGGELAGEVRGVGIDPLQGTFCAAGSGGMLGMNNSLVMYSFAAFTAHPLDFSICNASMTPALFQTCAPVEAFHHMYAVDGLNDLYRFNYSSGIEGCAHELVGHLPHAVYLGSGNQRAASLAVGFLYAAEDSVQEVVAYVWKSDNATLFLSTWNVDTATAGPDVPIPSACDSFSVVGPLDELVGSLTCLDTESGLSTVYFITAHLDLKLLGTLPVSSPYAAVVDLYGFGPSSQPFYIVGRPAAEPSQVYTSGANESFSSVDTAPSWPAPSTQPGSFVIYLPDRGQPPPPSPSTTSSGPTTTTTGTAGDGDDDDDGLTWWEILLIVVGSVAGLVLILALVLGAAFSVYWFAFRRTVERVPNFSEYSPLHD